MSKHLFAISIPLFIFGMLIGFTLADTNIQTPFGAVGANPEQPSPHDWFSEDDILVNNDRVTILLENPQWATFTNTNSMDPLLDEDAHGIQREPQNQEDIHVGDVISYRNGSKVIIHRVIHIGEDTEGWYAILKGDNNRLQDPGKIRYDQIERILVAIIY